MVIFYNIKAKGFGLFTEILTAPFVSKNIVFKIVLAPLNIFFRVIDEVVKPISLSLYVCLVIFLLANLFFILIALLYASGMIAGSAGVVLGYMGNIPYIDCINSGVCIYDVDCGVFKYGTGSALKKLS